METPRPQLLLERKHVVRGLVHYFIWAGMVLKRKLRILDLNLAGRKNVTLGVARASETKACPQ